MILLKNYIGNFLARAGSRILFASIIARGFSFLASWIALQLIPNKELGIILFAFNIVQFLIPIGGFGLHQGLIRYGSMLKSKAEKDVLFAYVFKNGLLTSILLILITILIGFLIPFEFKNTSLYLSILMLSIIPTFILEIIQIQFRLKHDNKSFANIEILHSIILVITIFLLSYFFKANGYIAALIFTPLLTSLVFIRKLNINFKIKEKLSIINFSFWKYGVFAGLSNVVTQLLFAVDIILIGFILNNSEMVTVYKYLTLIPFSLQFLPRAFINADFVSFTENIRNKKYITNYIKSYILLFSLISIVTCFFFGLFSNEVLNLFDSTFEEYNDTFLILIYGICGILIFRGLFGNLLSSIGKAHVNFYITSIALIINVISNYHLIPELGIKGAAITSALLMWFTGIASAILFWRFYNNRFLKTE